MTSKRSNAFFEAIDTFPRVEDDGLIRTRPFLAAAKHIVEFVNLMGIAFRLVKSDMNGNIFKLTKIYESDPDKYEYLNEIVNTEMRPDYAHDPNGCLSLLWLNRTLLFAQQFLIDFLKDYKQADSVESIQRLTEDLTGHFFSAYDVSLRRHHNWFLRTKVVPACIKSAPGRTSFLNYLGCSDVSHNEELRHRMVQSMDRYVNLLGSNTKAIVDLLAKSGYPNVGK